MAGLSSKIQNGLDEARILVLGTQVLVGVEFRAFFEEGYPQLPRPAQLAKLAGLAALLVALAAIVLPSAWHRLAERGEDSARMHRLTRAAVGVALLPLALALGLEVLVGALPVVPGAAVYAGIAAAAVALLLWYGLELAALRRRPPRREEDTVEQRSSEEKTEQKIRHVLTEARTVLPGAQALLGFQLAATLAKGFQELPQAARLVHLGAILLTAATVVLLVAPASWHRIVERGEITEGFHRVASRFVVAATVPLALALAADLGVVVWRVGESRAAALAAGGAALVALLATWIVAPLVGRAARSRRPTRAPARIPARA